MTFVCLFQAHSALFSGAGFGLSKAQVMTLITLSWFGWTTLQPGAGLTDRRVDVRHKRFLA